MSTDHASSVNGLALRATLLDATGLSIPGPNNSFVTNAFMSMGFTPEYTQGDEIEEKAADGSVCVYYKMPDVMKRVTLNLAVCSPDPELYSLLAGGTVLTSPGTSKTISNKALTSNVATLTTTAAHGFFIGDSVTVAGVGAPFDGVQVITAVPTGTTFSYACVNANISSVASGGTATGPITTAGWAAPLQGVESLPNGISLELWSRAIVAGRPAAVNPYWRWVFPYVKLDLDGERLLENGMMANTFAGWGIGNAVWGDGPQNDWTYASDRPYQYARSATAPLGLNGYQTVLA